MLDTIPDFAYKVKTLEPQAAEPLVHDAQLPPDDTQMEAGPMSSPSTDGEVIRIFDEASCEDTQVDTQADEESQAMPESSKGPDVERLILRRSKRMRLEWEQETTNPPAEKMRFPF